MEPYKAISIVKENLQDSAGQDAVGMEDQGRCIYTFVGPKGGLKSYSGACFSGIWNVTDRHNYKYIGFYVKKPIISEERHKRWVSFVMDYYTQLAGKKLFETTLEDLPYVVVNTDHQYNVIMSALTSMRMVYEQHFIVELWNQLVESGVDPVTAWVFTHLCDATPNDDGRFWLYMRPDREYSFYVPCKCSVFHTSLLTANFKKETLKRMYNREYVVGYKPHWRDSSGGVSGVHDLFGEGSDQAFKFVQDIFAARNGGGSKNNPFKHNDAAKAKKLSVEDTVKFFLSIVEDFEKEYKP